MNKQLTWSSISVAVAAIIIFVFLDNGSFYRVVMSEDKAKVNSTTPTAAAAAPAANMASLDIKIKNIAVNKNNDDKSATVRVAFDVHNPNISTMILDGIRYNVYVNNALITSGNIGTEAPEDVIRSQQGFPIIGNSIVTLKDSQTVQRNSINTAIWDKIVVGAAQDAKVGYIINGTYSFRQTANLQASGGINEFNLKFP
jgi:LEA14-like dessication related protein